MIARAGILLAGLGGMLIFGCEPSNRMHPDLIQVSYAPALIELEEPPNVIKMQIPKDNPLTREGIALGRYLFYDPILSLDSTQSCAGCHVQALAFSDGKARSRGVTGATGRRSAMSLVNVGYYYKGLFWDGRVPTLEEQSLHPVRDRSEMAAGWPLVEARLQRHPAYPVRFRAAFGITNVEEIDSALVAKALAQFERTMNSFDAPFDRVMRGEEAFSPAELRGWKIFFDADPEVPHSECNHCHIDPLFTNLEFHNNGLDPVNRLEDFQDKGLGKFTGNRYDYGKFRVPTLRNITLTAPYMHDGRFETLEEVIDHYTTGGHFAENVSPNVRKLQLTDQDKQDLLAFLKTLSDTSFVTREELSNPFLND